MPAYNGDRWIWEDLKLRVAKLTEHVRVQWGKGRRPPRMAFAWPGEEVLDDHGRPVDDLVTLPLPADADAPSIIAALAERTRAYAVGLLEVLPRSVEVTLESEHGVAAWTMALTDQGGAVLIGRPVVRESGPGLGVLFKPGP